ncbi:hypothetical protein [Mongoliitalea daihaiensis]|uniref:hypothetical protein n=1 Tax=Mongoliitalea daihaiensis TaxID=2782006 RepID=UPI001F2F00EC|nr:hypothetical protein [Mongoliitalea daihaiensis]UJP63825.1 hypothetical protein IPZ59_13425 [Mongoliitalea daihaiensis]
MRFQKNDWVTLNKTQYFSDGINIPIGTSGQIKSAGQIIGGEEFYSVEFVNNFGIRIIWGGDLIHFQ